MYNTSKCSKAERWESAKEQVEKRALELKALLEREKILDAVITAHMAMELLKKR